MLDRGTVADLVRGFADASDGESLKSRDLVLMLLECTPEPFSRHQFTPGHITATGLVLAADGERVLLVHHRRMDRWLLPGGHIEPSDDSAAGAAGREVLEETGAVLAPTASAPLAGIDVHGIPAKGAEPYHLHRDLMFAFQATAEGLRASAESRAVVWCHPWEFDDYEVPRNIRRAYRRIRGS